MDKKIATLSRVWRLNFGVCARQLFAGATIVVRSIELILVARSDRNSRSYENCCEQEDFHVLVHDDVCFRGEY